MYKLLIADDEPVIRSGISYLDWASLQIEVAASVENGQDAYDFILNNEVDIVLTDVKMPIMDGLELIEKINALDRNIVSIVLSGYDDYEYVRHCLKNNVFDYLLKPLDIDEWEKTFRSVTKYLAGSDESNMPDIKEHSKSHIIKPMLEYMQEHFCEQLTLSDVAEHIYTNPTYLSRVIKQETGMGFTELLTRMRIEEAKKMLKNPAYKINEISAKVGYINPRYFTYIFKKYTGSTPYNFRSE